MLAAYSPFKRPQVQILHLLSRPGCFTQKSQTGFYAGILFEATNVDVLAQSFPAVVRQQLLYDLLQGFAVKRVVGLRLHDSLFENEGNEIDIKACSMFRAGFRLPAEKARSFFSFLAPDHLRRIWSNAS